MKLHFLAFACCICLPVCCFAQEFPTYGTVSTEETALKQVPFDKDANAVILIDEASSTYDDNHRLLTSYHIRVKILKDKGISLANISLPYYRKDDYESIDMVEGMTINAAEGKQTENIPLERKSIFYKNINERVGEVVFAFPAIRVGSIIDYKYRSTRRDYGGLEDWEFQKELPVLISKFTLVIVPNMEFAYRVQKAPDMPVVVKKQSSDGSVYFEMKDIPGLGEEPYMDARGNYLQKVIFQLSGYNRYGSQSRYMTSWSEVTRELSMSSEFNGQLNKNIAGTDEVIKQIKLMPRAEDRMKAVFNYVRNNMSWNRLYSKYSMDGVKEAWQRKSGNSGDINLLLVNLLKEASLDAYPTLVSERFHGQVNTSYPFIDQFNSVFACVVINNRNYYLDATDNATPPHLTPYNILNTTAFIVNRKAGGLVNITNDTAQFKEEIVVDMKVADDGALSGEVLVKSDEYARLRKLGDYKADKKKFLDRYFIVDGTSIAGKDLEVRNLENDSIAFEQQCKISGNLTSTGEYGLLPLNLFTGFDRNPFLSDNRFSNINFGYRRTVNLLVSVQLPAGLTIDEIPKSVRLTNPDRDILFLRQLEYNKEDNTIRCMMLFNFKKSLYEADSYPILQEVYRKMFEYLKEPVVLKRKQG